MAPEIEDQQMVGGGQDQQRDSRIQRVIDDCICRRVAGEALPDEQVVKEHSELMPELGGALRNLALVERADQRLRDSSSGAGRLGDDRLPSTDSFPGYEVVGEIHRGGQGVVYQAVQRLTQRSVAIKVIRGDPHGDSNSVFRFEREVQILGQLNHPNILTVHDTGSTPDTFYYVTDYIRGDPLDEFISARELSIRETLQLFVKICDAVSAAHLLGVIHRDLKPSNILIDERAEPHVLDFGLAKLATGDALERTMTTTGQFVGSLPWASPEQVAGSPHEIDIRSDVYSLGVILYHALTRRFPYSVVGNVREVTDNILATEPIRPRNVRSEVDDEVETIVLKCLAKQPERRYQTAGELARDIRHYLAGEAIEAKRDSVAYVLRKQLRRYRLPTAIVTGFVFVAVIGFFVSLAFWRQAVDERNAKEDALTAAVEQRELAEDARDEAQRQAAIAQAVNDFLNHDLLASADLLGMPDPRKATGRDVTVREVLDAASERIEERFDGEPLVEAAIRMTLGNTYVGLGSYGPAEPHIRRALELRRAELGDEHPSTLISFTSLAVLYRQQGRYDEAEPLLLDALEARKRVLPDDHVQTYGAMAHLADLYREQGRYDEAEPLLREVVQARQRLLGAEHVETLMAIHNLALVFRDQGRLEEAETLLADVLETSRRVLGETNARTLNCATNLGMIHSRLAHYEQAEALYVETLEAQRRVLGEEHPHTLSTLSSLGALYARQGRADEAEPVLLEALELYQRTLGEEHRYTLRIAQTLATVYQDQARYDVAESLFASTLEKRRRVLGDDHPDTLAGLSGLGFLYQQQGRHAEAEPLLAEALERTRRLLGAEHPSTVMSMHYLAALYRDQGRPAEAEPLLANVAEIRRRTLGETHPHTLAAISGLAKSYTAQGRYDEAEPLARELVTLSNSMPDPAPGTVARSLSLLGDILLQRGDPEAAEAALRECLDIWHNTPPRQEWVVANAESLLGGCLTALGRYDEAEPLLLESCPRIESAKGEEDDLARVACQRVVELYEAWGRPEQAAQWRERLPLPDTEEEPPNQP